MSLENKKLEVIRRETARFKESENKLSSELESKRAELKGVIGNIRKKSFAEAQSLSSDLVTKITH